MPILLSSFLAIAFGLTIVAYTSPTISTFFAHPTSSLLTLHALLVDGTFALLIALTILCRVEPSWIAKNQSFPYSSQIEWNFGPKAFDFQLLVFEIFHTEWSSRAVHVVTIITEGFLWLLVIHVTFGLWGTGTTLALLSLQALSFGDPMLATVIITINTMFATASFTTLQYMTYSPIHLLNIAKVSLFWLTAIRILNHAFEPLPPTYDSTVAIFDDSFGYPAYQLCSTNFSHSLWMMALGQVSECGAGIPGHFFNQIIFKIMWKAGYRSKTLLDVKQAKKQAWRVIEGGWQAHPVTAKLYKWATKDCEELAMGAEKASMELQRNEVRRRKRVRIE